MHPKFRLVRTGSNEHIARQNTYRDLYENDGEFLYYDWGFYITINGEQHDVIWDRISKIIAYKKDLLTTDEINIDITTIDNLRLTVCESTLGWHQFLIHLNEEFHSIDPDWFTQVAHPAFQRNETILFERNNI